MRILFDPEFDLGSWPGPRSDVAGIAGTVWLGPEGLLSLLEMRLGLATPHASIAARASELVPRLFRADRFYGATAKADPWATAHRLLTWRDELWEHGWRGEGLGEKRLGELAEITLGLPPGPPERLEVAAGWLEGRVIDIDEVQLLVDRQTLSPAWQRVFAPLERAGTRIVVEPLMPSNARGNLASLRGTETQLSTNDRSVQLLRPHGPREGARLVAAALAADPGFGRTLFVGSDGILDDALAEFGLPTLGARSKHDANALGALLPLTLQLAWGPIDPQLALDWLTLPDSPLDRGIATRLVETLEVWPAVGNPPWMAVVSSLAKADPARKVLSTVFEPLADRQAQIRVRDFLPRVDLLENWARLQSTSSGHALVIHQAQTLRERFKLAELSRLSPPKLDAVLASVMGDGATIRHGAQVGYSTVGSPGGVAGPAPRIVWWNFHDTNSRRTHVALRASERRALASLGVELPSLNESVRVAATNARRPLLQAEETLLLVAPRYDQSGEPAHLHPLWDEITGRLRDPRDARHLQVQAPLFSCPAKRVSTIVAQTIAPSRVYRTSLPLAPRTVDSPSSLSKLLGCSFSYALDYFGRLRPRPSPRLSVESRLHGLLAHEVLAEVARRGALPGHTDADARRAALSILDEYLPTHATLLLLHGYHQELVLLRDAIGGTAELLSRLMQANGLRICAVEQEIRAEIRGRALRGTPDIVLEDREKQLVLLDFKWSGESYRREELRAGTSLQLAAYVMILGRAGYFVRSMGYLILRNQRVLVRGEPVTFAERIRPHGLGETWIATEQAWSERMDELTRGEIIATGVKSNEDEPIQTAVLDRGRLSLPPPCTYCRLDLLCGREKAPR